MTVKEYNNAVDQFADPVFRFIRGSIRDDDRAHDIVQDAFERLWMRVAEIEFKVVKSWLFSTSYNNMIDIIRHEKRIIPVETENLEEGMHNEHYSDLNEILHEALGRLPENQRSVVLLRDYEGYSYHEIGEITGQNEAQVKINIYRARSALRSYIGKIETII
ncbi:MAG TPA: RNA polymerase sigma factor [Bacteroidales bacterium]|nr:RNA polymerase sigma factor [Bacteroidales bacterium]